MNSTEKTVVLFDFDGVIVDTESQYSDYWNGVGERYLHVARFGETIKGQTLATIFGTHLSQLTEAACGEVRSGLALLERNMRYDYLPGVVDFIGDLRRHGTPMAVVTSSNRAKMRVVCEAHPELPTLFDRILTAEMFSRSKPHPECFQLGMELLGAKPANTFVFEDSFNGLKAARASGARVIGVAGTNPAEAIRPFCDAVLTSFEGLTLERMLAL